jgi:hypothetical protein
MTVISKLRTIALLVTVLRAPLSAQGPPPFTCQVNVAVPAPLRLEGLSELLSDETITCTGGTMGQIVPYNIAIFANVNVTNRTLNSATDALLLIDEPAPAQQVLNTNVFQGTLTSSNSITFLNVPIMFPGIGTRILRIVNLRSNAQQLGGQTTTFAPVPIQTFLSVSGSAAVNIANPQQVAGLLFPTTQFRLASSVGSFADQRTLQVSFKEDFVSAFKTRVAPGGQQNIP